MLYYGGDDHVCRCVVSPTPTMTRAYFDFDLQIDHLDANTFRARVLNSPAGQGETIFSLPFSEQELELFFLRIGRPRRGVRRINSPEMNEARAFGSKLYQAVFQGKVQECLVRSIDKSEEQGLRIRLRLPPALIDLPWEYLYDASLDRFFSHSTGTPIVRYLDLAQSIRPLAVTPPLKVLVMIASPSDYDPLDVEAEWQKIEASVAGLKERGLIQLTRLPTATLDALQRQFRRQHYHIFHFIGHGGFDKQNEEGVLLLEDEHGRHRFVSGNSLGALLHDHRSLRLAVLNACEGARTARSDPFSGVAQQLVRQGIPAVIAMQFEITDKAAIIMAREFYDALADGYPVDAALAEARKSIFAAENDIEWGTPVLYLRAADGRLFDIAPQLRSAEPAPLTPPPEDHRLSDPLPVRRSPDSSFIDATADMTVIHDAPSTPFRRSRWWAGVAIALLVLLVGIWQRQWIEGWFGQNRNPPIFTPTVSATTAGETPSSGAAAGESPIPTATLQPTTTQTPEPTHTATPTLTLTLAAGAQMTHPIDGAVYVYVPAGKFIMGSETGADDEKPAHEVTLDAFWIMQTEVTNEQYKKCVDAGACTKPSTPDWGASMFWSNFGQDPVVNVTWSQVSAYAKWAGGRLPTEAEWEKAARGPDGNIYPWGKDPPNDELLNFDGNNETTTEVGQYQAGKSYYGALDMAGNVWEWVADWYDVGYYQSSPPENPTGPASGQYHVVRGGSWYNNASDVRSSSRSQGLGDRFSVVGFRVVRSSWSENNGE
jgi:formylglycine-generating enzyme required for sulfatase activity/CHAT domain-containing protein